MRILHTAILVTYLAASTTAWIATVTEWVTLDPSVASSSTVQTPSDVRIKAFSGSTTPASPIVLPTTTTSPAPSDTASETPSSTPSPISSEPTSALLQATSQSAQPLPIASTASAPEYGTYNAGSPGSGSEIDSDAGASGSSSSFSLSRGGMIAVIVVVAVVAIFGTVASTTLFILAKRRQWNVRARLSRASRRLTGGRFGGGGGGGGGGAAVPRPPPPAATTNHRRVTVTAGRLKGGNTDGGGDNGKKPRIPVDATPLGLKAEQCGVRTQVSSHPLRSGGEGRDLEKGDVPRLVGGGGRRGGRREGSWVRRLWGDGWK
ncbi:hypothetical protein D0862_09463 [Hortaea werneckii]|uniref:Mid2 domain-containing protein n=1 Tax=Hortaea werneckii TaxID=91943 RepID=A0A3M7FVN6_HORWE|nr:hypothetical protein D0862_09463 [Hortaea werneckii]